MSLFIVFIEKNNKETCSHKEWNVVLWTFYELHAKTIWDIIKTIFNILSTNILIKFIFNFVESKENTNL
jgi:hypothetical protein